MRVSIAARVTLSPAWLDELRARTLLSAVIAPSVKLIKAGREFGVLAENALGEYVLGSAAASDGQLFIRTGQHVYCIGKRTATKAN